eukprot:7588856-Alexandrium_andersonii.AAC.1
MEDVTSLVKECRPLLGAPPITSQDVEFADDTVILSTDSTGAQLLLQLLQEEASGYGLQFNKTKTAHMSINSNQRICFADGGQVPLAAVVKYLGVKIEATGGSSEEVANRLAAASASYAMLRPLWRSSKIPTSQKIRIYQA